MADEDSACGGEQQPVEQSGRRTPTITVETLPLPTDLNLPKDPNLLKQTDGAATNKGGTLPKQKKDSSRSSSPQTRSQGPARLITPYEVGMRADLQVDRMNELLELQQFIQDKGEWCSNLIDEVKHQVDELTRSTALDGETLQLLWSQEVSDHPYFREKIFSKALNLGNKLRRRLAELKTRHAPPPAQPTAQVSSTPSKLPDISLPHFTGTYSDWPYFQDMFVSMILREERITPVQKLHYLRNCLSGEPAQIVSSFEVRDSSFEPAWQALKSRYDNKRLAIQSHLDKLFNIPPLTQKTAEGLNRVVRVQADAKRGLEALNVADRLGDMMLVHLTVRSLDRSTREAWETSLGSSQEFPTSAQVEQFVQAKARALERVEQAHSTKPHAAQHPANPKGTGPRRSAHAASKTAQPAPLSAQSASATAPASQKPHQGSASAQQSKTSSFTAGPTAHACDYCEENHYVVACPHFRQLRVRLRMEFVERRKLCYNCLGRHSVRSCKSAHRCKVCNAQHHTMLHGYKPAEESSPSPQTSSTESTD